MIVFLVEVFQGAKHADDFLNGRLYANTLAYFKKVEGEALEGTRVPSCYSVKAQLLSSRLRIK